MRGHVVLQIFTTDCAPFVHLFINAHGLHALRIYHVLRMCYILPEVAIVCW